MHLPEALHSGAAVFAQSAAVTHCTHVESATLHRAVGAAHVASVEQPPRHLRLSGSQMGVAPPQSAFERH